jgi:hypothetical protein
MTESHCCNVREVEVEACQPLLMTDAGQALDMRSGYQRDLSSVGDAECFFCAMGALARERLG